MVSRHVSFVTSAARPPLCRLPSTVPLRRTPLEFDTGDLKRTKSLVTLHEGLNKFHSRRRHKFATKALLRNNRYFYIVDSEM